MSSQDRLIKQVHFPKIVLPIAATVARHRQLRVRPDPAHGPAAPVRTRAASRRTLLLMPVIASVQLAVHAGSRVHRLGRQRLLPRRRQRQPARAAPVVLPVARRCTARRRSRASRPRIRSSSGSCSSTRSTSCSPRTARVIYGAETANNGSVPPMHPTGPRSARCSGSVILLVLATIFFKRIEPSFAKVL